MPIQPHMVDRLLPLVNKMEFWTEGRRNGETVGLVSGDSYQIKIVSGPNIYIIYILEDLELLNARLPKWHQVQLSEALTEIISEFEHTHPVESGRGGQS